MAEEYFPINEEQWQESGSKFAKPGLHLSEMGMPSWKEPGKSYQFPFTIIEEGEDQGKESALYTGMVRFSLQPIFKACGVPYEFKNGKLAFDKMAFVGKHFKSIWQEFTDSRSPEEGGKGGKYTKAVGALPADATTSDLGIG